MCTCALLPHVTTGKAKDLMFYCCMTNKGEHLLACLSAIGTLCVHVSACMCMRVCARTRAYINRA